jgi:G3E family GTPase
VLVDAAKILKWLKVATSARNQIEMATIILINKIDIASKEQVEEVRQTMTELNPQAKIFCTSYGNVHLASLLQPSSISTEKPIWIAKNLREAYVTVQIERNIALVQLEAALAELNDKIFRAKGFIVADEKNWYVDYSGRFEATPVHHAEETGKLVLLYDIALVNKKEILEVFHKHQIT